MLMLCMTTKAQPTGILKPYRQTDLRLPSVPLIVNDPYFSIWSPYDKLTDGTTRHWTDQEKPLEGYLRVDDTTYQWMVTSTADNTVVASGSFPTRGLLHQVYFTPDVRNGRDLGGYKGLGGKTVAFHKLYRGGRIDKKYCDETGRAEMLAEGIRAEVDLREADDVPKSSPLGSSVDFYAPGFDSGYNEMVRDNQPKVKETFCWVVARLREGKPVYFHCAAGRDRTATLAILLEGALGISESDMAKDYELSYFSPADWGMSTDDNGNPVYKHTRDNYSYGSVRKTIFKEVESGTYQERIVKYLLKIGVPQQDIDDLRAIMLQ